jgi:hypothetical protein
MKNTAVLLALGFALAGSLAAQTLTSQKIELVADIFAPPSIVPEDRGPSARIKNIQRLPGGWGMAFTDDAIFITEDDGSTWRGAGPAIDGLRKISAARFSDRLHGYAIVSRSASYELEMLRTNNGGRSWQGGPVQMDGLQDSDAYLEEGSLVLEPGRIEISFPVATSSNFSGSIRYRSDDDGLTWRFVEKRVELRTSDDVVEPRSGDWTLTTEGSCAGFKTGCVQATKILAGGVDVTPTAIRDLTRRDLENARAEALPMFAAPPGGATRISLNRGFDKCTAAPASQMQIWWDHSYFQDANIYISGRNRGCSQGQLTANWVDQVSNMGWGLIPTIVGYQSPCTASTTSAKLSYDVAVAEQQGRGEADIAAADATALGITTGSVLYYDMERYDPPNPDTLGCRPATLAFLKGWTDRVHELGYISGVYGSPFNANPDWVNLPTASRMDAIWMARWDNIMSVWTYLSFPTFPTNVWNNHQRIKQWQAPHNETWGGVTFNIDGNIADGPVAGPARAKNRTADFDGDRKTDVSVFRPDTGVWYVQRSDGLGYTIVGFGVSTDRPTPGDYDGDGKTDIGVFRPADGGWHLLGKGWSYTARGFGLTGDIPAPADFNGDGRTDVAVYRPSTGVWYVANSDSLGTYTIVQFGLDGDKPVPADYDGDGKADIAVWRPSTGVWYVLRSSDGGATATAWGIPTDQPAQGDYDGDGKADPAVLRDGIWYLLQSTEGISAFQFGLAGDLASTGDFDGDGEDDPAVFRPSNGTWYVQQSTAGFYAVNFGVSGDKPVPNAYLPQP